MLSVEFDNEGIKSHMSYHEILFRVVASYVTMANAGEVAK